jgi:hypothetical protein
MKEVFEFKFKKFRIEMSIFRFKIELSMFKLN